MMSEALRLIRVYHDMSKSELARELGFSRSFISEIESGSKKATIDTLNRYSDYFEIPLSSLLLFAERTSDSEFTERARSFVADKALKMLDWVSTTSRKQSEKN